MNESLLNRNNIHKNAERYKGVKINYTPKSYEELLEIITKRIEKEGPEANLNDIDVSSITFMDNLFYGNEFNGDISQWDVSNVESARSMFLFADKFNGNISSWEWDSIKDMSFMFANASSFKQDLSAWNIKRSVQKVNMFQMCPAPKPTWYK